MNRYAARAARLTAQLWVGLMIAGLENAMRHDHHLTLPLMIGTWAVIAAARVWWFLVTRAPTT